MRLKRRGPSEEPTERHPGTGGAKPGHRQIDGIPEVEASDCDAATIGSAFVEYGYLLVRGLLAPEAAQGLAAGIDSAIAARDALSASESDQPEPECAAWFEPFEPDRRYDVEVASWNRIKPGSGAVWASDSPRMLFELVGELERAGAISLATDYLGERPSFSMNKSVLRRSPPGTGAAWHQDGAFLGRGIRTLNIWLALNDCGVDAPGLDLFPRRLEQIVETGSHGATFVWSVSDQLVEEMLKGGEIASPVFHPGDALLFDHLCLHRTGVKPEMSKTRYATETWCFAPSVFPPELVPIVL